MTGTRGSASRTAVVNLAQLARQEQLAPPSKQPLAVENEFDELEAAPRSKPVPAGANTPSDRLLPEAMTTAAAPSPAPAASFQALDDDNSRIPPDTHGAVGPNHLMVTLNSQVRIQTKTGATISTVSLNGFWATFGHTNVFDPRALYDPYSGRWIFTALADYRTATSSLLVSVSQTGNPTGNWNLYEIDIDTANVIFADYPNIGFNKDWIVVTTDTFRISDSSFVAARIYTFGKANLYAGGASAFTLFQDTSGSSQVPAVMYDNTAATMYIVENWNGNQGGSGYLRLSTISGAVGAESYTPGIAFPSTPNPWDSVPPSLNWAPQLGSAQGIRDGDAVVQNMVYRNGSLWCAQTIFLPTGGSPTRSAIQWWQLSPSGVIQQRGRIDDASGNVYYSFPSIAVNSHNDAVIGYSRFSTSFYAGSSYSMRAAGDPLNTLRDVAVLKNGEAPYYKTNGGSKNKWGDFSATVVDPANDVDIWTIQEYAATPAAGADRWGTWWGRFDLATIPPLPPPASDVVLYASEAPVRVGNWQVVADATAAGGARIWNPDAGAAKIVTPFANPPSYFEMTFNAQANTAYHLWMRGKAQNDSPYNDSVHVQFSDSVDATGTAVFRIGTTTSTEYNLEDCSGCGVSGWGWQDNGWGVGVMGSNIYFAATGTHTIRVQVREDGLSIDQIVLSPSTYLNSAPGALKNDTTIVPKSGGGSSPAPTVSSITPNSGTTVGGTSVTISGTNFVSGASVKIGGTAASGVAINNSTTITATTPAHAAGAANVVVTNPDNQSGTLASGFTYTASTAQTPRFGHVFVVVEENHSYANVIGSAAMPYLNSLASRYGLATNYYANTHPSIGNYFMLTTGQIVTNDSNFTGTVAADNLVRQMVAAGKTWKAYAESLPSVGWTGGDQYPYVKRHNPFAYITDVLSSTPQTNNLVPFSQFAGDLASNQLPNFSYLLPNQLNNGHDCPSGSGCTDADKLAATDTWLNTNIAPLLASAVFQQDGLLVLLWDESLDTDTANGGGQVAALVISPRAKPGYQSTTFYQHQSTLRTIAEAMGLTSFPGASASAPSMAEFFNTSTSPTPNVSSITPNSGTTAGGTSVTISGSGFTTGATLMIGGVPATSVFVTSSTTITATTPAHAAGAVSVTVTNTNGLSGTRANGFTYTVPAGETVLLADDFNDNALDQTKWQVGNLFSGFTDAALPTLETNQRLEIGALLRQTGSSHYNGLVSRQRYNFTNAYVYVAVVQAPAVNTTADAMLTIGQDANNYYRLYEEAGVIYVQKRLLAGTKVTMWSAAYEVVAHRYWRIRHDGATGNVVFETAPDNSGVPGAWVVRYSEAWSVAAMPLGSVLFEVKGGTWQAEAGVPGKVIFDDFKAAKP